MKVVPQLLYRHESVRKIMVDGLSCIVHKTMDTIDTETDHYVAASVLSVVLTGTLILETHEEEGSYRATQNQMVLIPKGRYMISDVIPDKGKFEAVFFFFDEEVLHQFLMAQKDPIQVHEVQPHLVLKYTEPIKAFTEAILNVYQNDPLENRAVTKLKLLELLYLIYNSEQKAQLVQVLWGIRKQRKANIKELMQTNYDKPLTIEDYAFLSGRSPSTFSRDFKNLYGILPKKWLVEKRMQKAEELLRASQLSVSQVALEVGYENISHFISAFGKLYKISPKQFLIQHRMNKAVG